MNITISTTNKQPREDAEKWSFDISELEHVLENTCEGGHYEYYNGRLYEAEPIHRPFWSIEKDYLDRRESVARACSCATTLKEALETGVNSIRVKTPTGFAEDYVSYLAENGDFDLAPAYEDKNLDKIKVEFYSLDRDDDGYTVGIFTLEGGNNE